MARDTDSDPHADADSAAAPDRRDGTADTPDRTGSDGAVASGAEANDRDSEPQLEDARDDDRSPSSGGGQGASSAGERCPYCGRPLRDAGIRALHVGEAHAEEWTDGEREAYERARDAEIDALFRYHVKIVGALVVLIFGLVYTYVFALA